MSGGAAFYQTRSEKIESLLNTPSRDLSEQQKEYWRNMSNEVDTPLQYGYYGGWEIIMSSFELLMFALLAVCIMLAPVFAGEYQAGTDAVILAGKINSENWFWMRYPCGRFCMQYWCRLHFLLRK